MTKRISAGFGVDSKLEREHLSGRIECKDLQICDRPPPATAMRGASGRRTVTRDDRRRFADRLEPD
jgi:hypothetical protein